MIEPVGFRSGAAFTCGTCGSADLIIGVDIVSDEPQASMLCKVCGAVERI